MARPSPQVMVAAAAGAGLVLLCGCGSAAAPGAAGSASSGSTSPGSTSSGSTSSGSASAAASGPARLASHFCTDASRFMRNIPAEPKVKHLTPAQARASLTAVLVSTAHGFAGLEKEAPARLRKPLRKIIAVYRADEKVLRTGGDMSKVSQSMVQGDGSGSTAFQQVLMYMSGTCY